MGKEVPRIECHLYGVENNHHGHQYRRGDQTVHCPGRHNPGRPYVSTKRNKQPYGLLPEK